MRRFALLIEASQASGQAEIRGCQRDAERLNSWLSHVAGGAWEKTEISVLHNPSWSNIAAAKRYADIADFAFVAFSGHGRLVEDWTGRRSQMVVIGTGEEIDFRELVPAAGRSVMVCDACREIHRPARFKRAVAEQYERLAADRFTREDYRQAFDYAAGTAPSGTYTMYSCSPGQCAGDDPLNGGTFTDALLSASGDWWDKCSQSAVLTVDKALDLARPIVSATSRQSNPEYPQDPTGGPSLRTGNPFPFAVRLK